MNANAGSKKIKQALLILSIVLAITTIILFCYPFIIMSSTRSTYYYERSYNSYMIRIILPMIWIFSTFVVSLIGIIILAVINRKSIRNIIPMNVNENHVDKIIKS
ncbi:hypothetical protein ACX1NA_03130 [Mycoplasma sp. VS276A1]